MSYDITGEGAFTSKTMRFSSSARIYLLGRTPAPSLLVSPQCIKSSGSESTTEQLVTSITVQKLMCINFTPHLARLISSRIWTSHSISCYSPSTPSTNRLSIVLSLSSSSVGGQRRKEVLDNHQRSRVKNLMDGCNWLAHILASPSYYHQPNHRPSIHPSIQTTIGMNQLSSLQLFGYYLLLLLPLEFVLINCIRWRCSRDDCPIHGQGRGRGIREQVTSKSVIHGRRSIIISFSGLIYCFD